MALEYKMENVALGVVETVDVNAEKRDKFKMYRKFNNATVDRVARAIISERHNYFSNYPNKLKRKAKKILNKEYESVQHQVMDLFKVLNLKPRYRREPSVNKADCLVSVELDCDYDVYIIALKSDIHTEIIEYFRNMLL